MSKRRVVISNSEDIQTHERLKNGEYYQTSGVDSIGKVGCIEEGAWKRTKTAQEIQYRCID
jgi:hypothetical protein